MTKHVKESATARTKTEVLQVLHGRGWVNAALIRAFVERSELDGDYLRTLQELGLLRRRALYRLAAESTTSSLRDSSRSSQAIAVRAAR